MTENPSSSRHAFDGRVALVTGGGSGIGRAIALELAGAGADVAVCGRREAPLQAVAEEIRRLGRRALAAAADVSKPEADRALIERVAADLGGLDVLVNNAGIARQGPFGEITDEDVDALVDIDLKGPVFTVRAALPRLIESGAAGRSPAILNVGSNVTRMALKGYAVYSAAKAGLDMLTRCLALELAEHRIRVNAVLPGVIATPIFDTMMDAGDASEFIDTFGPQVPLGRVGQPGDVARIAVALCDPANDWVTGALVPVDGGLGLGPG
ncbi:MAG: SDR family NAD(P)-dependent oxidoreductase [Acidobacteria bacterium]|nr:MAG: SDR family NAD(P)-dependent oxidoreductase [Acidobacteriota bacterium]REK08415.1 MAG: SDR family NAD(P)-dependent oxidoreductase [Acidobacteriota bacterium]